MRRLIGFLGLVCIAAFPARADTNPLCERQPIYLGLPLQADSRACRLDGLVSRWLLENGIRTAADVSFTSRVESIGSSLADDRVIFDDIVPRPLARIELAYWLERSETEKVNGYLGLRPGFFIPLADRIRRVAPDVICDTLTDQELEFLGAGGELRFTFQLKRRVVRAGYGPILLEVAFNSLPCEVH